MRVGIYARVSTADKGQDPELQLQPLREYCRARGFEVQGEYVDYCTGIRSKRPQLDILMKNANRRHIDCIIVWKLDRFGRSLKHLVNAIDELNSVGIVFISHQEQIDLSTPTGKLMFHIIAAMAEFERSLIKERVRAGIANAKQKGKRVGRTPIPPIDRRTIIELSQGKNLSVRKIAKKVKMSKSAVHKTLADFEKGLLDSEGFKYERRECP